MGNKNSTSKNDKNTVIGRITGGLGNQLFVIASTYAYARKYDKNFYITNTTNNGDIVYWDNILSYLKKDGRLVFNHQIKKFDIYKYKDVNYTEIPYFDKHTVLEGYFQSDKYFKEYKREILKLLSLPEYYKKAAELKVAKFNEETIVAVHIRRGDYLKYSNVYHLLSKNYYDNAKQVLEEKLGFRPIYLYFTNDKKWVRENFTLENKDEIIDLDRDFKEFCVMQQCHHFIIANSSFSWWAAYLSDVLEGVLPKYVIAPRNWYKHDTKINWSDIYPEDWILEDDCNKSFNNIKSKFFLGIITCKKYENKRKSIDNPLYNYKYFIGDASLETYREENNIVYLPCPDNYESLPLKVYQMIKYVKENYPDVDYIIKADDDVTFDFNTFNNLLYEIYSKKIDYAGVKVKTEEYYGTCHLGKTEDKELSLKKILVPKSIYCAGPCYIISKKSCKILLENLLKNNTIYEDQSIGSCLEKFEIIPYDMDMKNKGCYWV
jgi:hypothetical protein